MSTMKKSLLALAVFALLLFAGSAQAEFAVITNTSSLNLREGPGYDYDVAGAASRGDWVDVQGESDSWYAVTILKSGKSGYMDSAFLTYGSSSGGDTSAVTGVVSNPKASSFLNLREYPSYTANVLGIYYNGAVCTILSSYNGWYEVSIDGMTGYFRYEYVKVNGASGTATVVASSGRTVNLRSGPSTAYDVLERCPTGSRVSVLLKGNGFWKVSYNGLEGYMSSGFLSTSGNVPSGGGSSGGTSSGGSSSKPSTSGYVIVSNPNANNLLNLRAQPSASGKILAQYPNGTRFEVVAQGATWCKVYGSATGRTGYMQTKYLTLYGLPGTPTKTVKNGKSYVNLRSAPSKSTGSVIVRVSSGKTVTVLTPGDEWTQVRFGSNTGYMMTYFLK